MQKHFSAHLWQVLASFKMRDFKMRDFFPRRPGEGFTLRWARAEDKTFPVGEGKLRGIMKDQEVGVFGKGRGRGRDSIVTGENEGEGKRKPGGAL